jgi:hypothetical protein
VPVIGDFMATRWAYEAICVEQFKSNRFEKPFFEYEMTKSQNDWYATFLVPTLKVKVDECLIAGKKPEYKEHALNNFRKINLHLKELSEVTGMKPQGDWMGDLNYDRFNDIIADDAKLYLDSLGVLFRQKSRLMTMKQDSLIDITKRRIGEEQFIRQRERDYNESLADFVLNRNTTIRLYEADDKLVQKADPVFMKPGSRFGRAHFFAPYKQLGNLKIETLLFNMVAIWIMSIALFITLYFDILKKFILFLETLKLPIWRKFGRELLQI